MYAWLHPGFFTRRGAGVGLAESAQPVVEERAAWSAWSALPLAAQVYIAGVVAIGAFVLVTSFPLTYPRPLAFAALLVVACLTSIWKVKLVLSAKNESTLSVSYASVLMTLILLGPHAAMVVAVAAAWTQCTFRVHRRYPAHCTIFSMAAEAITVQATGVAYAWLGGQLAPLSIADLPQPLVGAIAAHFLVNTGLVAGAIALSARQPLWKVWHDNFLWSGPSFFVAGVAGAGAAVVIDRGEYAAAILMLAPVYLTYRTYRVFLGRLADQKRHVEETEALHREAVEALAQARRAERALADEKERLSVTLRSIGDGVIATDLEGRIQLVNHAAEQLTGWTQDEAIGLPIEQVFHSLEHDTGAARFKMLAARDRSERPIEEIAAPLQDATGRIIGRVVAFRDISDALRMQAERARADKLASLGLLAGGIAHDFNNILMAVMGNVSMARATLPSTGHAVTALTQAEQACVRARHLTWNLLTFSKGGAPDKKTIALPRLLEEAARLALCGSNIPYTLRIDPDLWPVHADDRQLTQVVNNILINAQQAMPRGGTIEIVAENVVEREQRSEYALQADPGPYVRISISDSGTGIAPENLGSIFDPYFTTKQTGSGLGLATSHSIVKNHGGFFLVDSTLGRGTTVRVHLPASLDRELEESASAIERASGGGRILVMDGDANLRALAVSMLEFLGYTPEVVSSGSAAVERYKRAMIKGRPFDAVILDLVVPEGMGGKEAMAQLGAIDRKVTAILSSGYVEDSMIQDFEKLGFKAIIPKPFTLGELSKTLHAVMAPHSLRVH
ncbi:MAG TPA: ATP-binding protein [Vicinamibacterales bacterium]|nr:ATP-binding protein [Vicinamibacterales bacterium]